MGHGNLNIILALVGLLCLISSAVASEKSDDVCPGPIKYYEELGCTPIFKNSGDSCPIRFDCDKWANLTEHQCLVNGHVYEHGDHLRKEDSNSCEGCTCRGSEGWTCASPSCLPLVGIVRMDGPVLDCYQKRNPSRCCPDESVCVEENERPTCVVDGKTYKDGEFFVPSTEPEKKCYCGEGYTGENIEPFCASPKHTWCKHVLREVHQIRANCIPVYDNGQSLNTECNFSYSRCQNEEDYVINPKPEGKTVNPDMLCKFGTMTMKIGEELNHDTTDKSRCLKCVCEVPPVPTCQYTDNLAECN